MKSKASMKYKRNHRTTTKKKKGKVRFLMGLGLFYRAQKGYPSQIRKIIFTTRSLVKILWSFRMKNSKVVFAIYIYYV